MLFLGVVALLMGVVAILVFFDVISLADPTARGRLLDKRTLDEAKTEHKRFKMIETSNLARKLYRPQTLQKIERKIVVAGYPDLWTIRNIMIGKIIMPLVATYLIYLGGFLGGSTFQKGIGVGVIVVAWFVPNLLLNGRAVARTELIDKGLPDLLDKLYISLKAGLGFDAALSEALKTASGPLTDELIRTMQDVRVGMPRRDAYDSLRLRTESDSLHSFIRSVQQAEEKGTSIANIVKLLSKEMRIKRRLRAEGKAQQVSVMLLAPLMTCIFPVLFVVVLAPGIMSAIQGF